MSINGCVMLQIRLNNAKVALKVVLVNQKATKSPKERAQLEEDVKDLTSRIEELEWQIKTNLVET